MGVEVGVRGVSRTYGSSKALDEVTLEIEAGQAVALMGPSGAGKSTLLHLVGAMDLPDGGEVHVGGERVDTLRRRGLDRHRRRVGFVFQRFHLLPALSVLDNVLAPVLPRRVDFDRRARARELLEAVGLAGRERALPGELSGGQQQRVAVARALICHPPLLLADEPTGNLDSVTGQEIVDLLFTLREEYGMTMLVATHNPEVAAACDRVVRMRDGRIIGDDRVTPAENVLDRIGRLG
ncbi:ABC transporter ATP-binding protein [Planomonospora venezuelensis]|uniref:Putative ABC transport system ATP-binding protein n=1 Tax=Planomonospora venezuelensis TaxID=1999 RepID=A0A841DF21_PLAVE|nr:ABC transporter ATP-binding protein [Planomonospora venezuelensis]MBB5965866.1 putative ABC transport system ATP-binding protein [Planomonospora venezuelensis]